MGKWFMEKDWWKSPILQGEENDYGDYDYLIEEIPQSYCRWEFSKIAWEDDCGHCSHLRKVWCDYFRTMDGYDSMSGSDCWRCVLKDTIKLTPRKFRRKIKTMKRKMEIFIKIFQVTYKRYSLKVSIKAARVASKTIQ